MIIIRNNDFHSHTLKELRISAPDSPSLDGLTIFFMTDSTAATTIQGETLNLFVTISRGRSCKVVQHGALEK